MLTTVIAHANNHYYHYIRTITSLITPLFSMITHANNSDPGHHGASSNSELLALRMLIHATTLSQEAAAPLVGEVRKFVTAAMI